jgi:tRNA-5-methyluridine54 2-sulfurtransferase
MKIKSETKKALKQIGLKKPNKILIAISGGKDSIAVAYLLKKFGYNVGAIFIDLCIEDYSKKCLGIIKEFCEQNKIKIHVYNLEKMQGKKMKYFWNKNKKLNHCTVCGVFKKWILNREARRLKFDYIATGHNIDDETETILLNICKGNPELSLNSGVIIKNISDKKFVPRIKPLFYFENKEIKEFVKKEKLKFVEGICPYRENPYRIEIRNFVDGLTKKQKKNIIKNFEEFSKKIKKRNRKMIYCKICGEPTKREICKKCELMD